ncbi:GntR family transcriptional regulator [Parasedimentitalea marina]|uniref:GntR family transcriptional regulator n=1 Tax=Parasedimentitalea marina TaxID=2483033 RepID=A0A3T0N1S0_9RHOB|nr:GntR family transcriptional regulator [Parasedimentitalea marina]AZV77973.1 GntR family transcriptional regulator [Parasedimentitalea marina]
MSIKSPVKTSGETIYSSEPDENLIVERIYKAVMEQQLAPNTKLSEARLCETFGVGRMRVRRALLLLSSQGIIDLHSNRGAYVACPDKSEAKDVFDARLLIEPPLVRQLAQAPSEASLALLADHIELEDAARRENERTEVIRLSGEFHTKLAQAIGNKSISRMMRELVTRTSLIVGLFGSSENASCPDDEHTKILNAIQSRDPERAEELLISHLNHIQSGLDMDAKQQPQDDLVSILGST